jgi:heme ABC exporter ATP-binding subunit CcmA/heme exporter protein CcmB
MMIDVHALTKSFGPRQALAGVDLHIAPGECIVLCGPNGAGKTTLLRILATLARPTSGVVRIAGLDPVKAGADVRQQIGFLSHHTLLYDDLTAEQNLAFYARMYALSDAQARIDELLERVGLSARRHDLVRTYSRGMQQRLAVARAVLHRPPMVLLDEPYTGLDPLAADALTALLTDLTGEGCTLLLTSHNLQSDVTMNRRAVVLNRGRIVYDAPYTDAATFPALYRELVKESRIKNQESANQRSAISNQPSAVSIEQLAASNQQPASSIQHPVSSIEHPATSIQQPTTHNPQPAFLRQVWAIVAKDIAAELHTREIFSAMFVFAVLALLIFSFTLDLRGALAQAAAPGVLWATIAFAGTLGLSRSMAREQQTGGIEGLLLAPVDRAALFFGKALGNLMLMLAVEVVLIPLAMVMFNVGLLRGSVLLTALLGTVAYAAVGTLLAAIAVNTRAREVMLPILLLPLLTPLLIAAVKATGALLEGATWAEIGGWGQILVVYNLVIIAVALLTFGYVIEE